MRTSVGYSFLSFSDAMMTSLHGCRTCPKSWCTDCLPPGGHHNQEAWDCGTQSWPQASSAYLLFAFCFLLSYTTFWSFYVWNVAHISSLEPSEETRWPSFHLSSMFRRSRNLNSFILLREDVQTALKLKRFRREYVLFCFFALSR